MAVEESATPVGLAALVVAASLMEALRKRGVLDEHAAAEVMDNALLYMQAFAVDQSPEFEQETRRLLDMLSKASGQARGELPEVPDE
jgi:hypothetical protein